MPNPTARLKELTDMFDSQQQKLQVFEANVKETADSIEQLRGAIALCKECVEKADSEEDNGEGDTE